MAASKRVTKAAEKKADEPTIRITHYTGSTLIAINRAYPEGLISSDLAAAVKEVLEKHK